VAKAPKPDWDADSSVLAANLAAVEDSIRRDAAQKVPPTLQLAREWHIQIMKSLQTPDPNWVGRFRGESGLERIGVKAGALRGTAPDVVAAELAAFEVQLTAACQALDDSYSQQGLDADVLEAAVEVAAWVHSKWVQIHPFANGNGRTARIWANWVLLRYGIRPVLRLRPRPDSGYADAGRAGMEGDFTPMAAVIHALLAAGLPPPTARPRAFR